MPFRTLLPILLLLLSLPVDAANEKSAPSPAAASDDFSSYRTADELWNHFETLRKQPTTQPQSREEFVAIAKQWFTGQQRAADAFLKRYPTDPRRYAAQVVSLQATMQLGRLGDPTPGAAAERLAQREQLEAVIAAPDAPDEVKGEATYIRAIMLTENLSADKPETIANFLQAAESFLAKYGNHRLAGEMRQAQLDVATQATTPEADAALQKLTSSDDERIAMMASQLFTRRRMMKEFATKPLSLKYKATDGTEVDVEKLRGKVVLVDFWASWCAPCIMEMPGLVTTYQKLREKGFEIVGISLDQEKEAMDAVIKKHQIPWRQYFDGQGWQNAVSAPFGINALPTTWLVDKKGMVRAMNVSVESLGEAVEKLLAE